MGKKRLVSIIIVNYNGRHFLEECLQSVFNIDYPSTLYEVIVVDNNSQDDSTYLIRSQFPKVILIQNTENKGFAGGNIIGLQYAKGEYIVLLNTDTKVDSHWLTSLVRAAEPSHVGIVNSKLYFAIPFLQLRIQSSTITRSELQGNTDFSTIGILLEDIVCSQKEFNDLIWYGPGFYEKKQNEITLRWTKEEAIAYIPFNEKIEENRYKITVHGYPIDEKKESEMSIYMGDKCLIRDVVASRQVKQYTININRKIAKKYFFWLIQNTGNIILSDGYGKDRGSLVLKTNTELKEFYERDSEYFNSPTNLLAFCGASCLIKREVLDVVGFFDERYYMYYEDLDLSLRVWFAGWDILFEPTSIVYHKHKGSTSMGSNAFMLFYVERNHIYFLLTYFPLVTILIEMMLFTLRLIVTWIKMSTYKFRDNVSRYELWQSKFLARQRAARDIVFHMIPFLQKRWSIKRSRVDSAQAMSKYLY